MLAIAFMGGMTLGVGFGALLTIVLLADRKEKCKDCMYYLYVKENNE